MQTEHQTKSMESERKQQLPEVEQSIGSLDDDEVRIINLVSNEQDMVEVDSNFACISKLIETCVANDASCNEINIDTSTSTLRLVVEYMFHHKGNKNELIKKPLVSNKMIDVCSDSYDATFIDNVFEKQGNEELYQLILAANYMDIQCLLHLGCAKIASLIKGQPLESIKKILSTSDNVCNFLEKI
jgi:S-phase kinase-associated protein 1